MDIQIQIKRQEITGLILSIRVGEFAFYSDRKVEQLIKDITDHTDTNPCFDCDLCSIKAALIKSGRENLVSIGTTLRINHVYQNQNEVNQPSIGER